MLVAKRLSASLKVINHHGGLEGLAKDMRLASKGANVEVGVFDSGVRDGGLTNAQLAAVHEYGTRDKRIPERSFIRSTLDKNRAFYFTVFIPRVVKAVLERRMSFDQGLGIIGQKVSADVKATVIAGDPNWAPLAPATLARKQAKGSGSGSVKTLIDTGRMLASITYAVIYGAKREVKKT